MAAYSRPTVRRPPLESRGSALPPVPSRGRSCARCDAAGSSEEILALPRSTPEGTAARVYRRPSERSRRRCSLTRSSRRLPLINIRGEEADARLFVLLRGIQRLLLGETAIDCQIVDDRLALVDGSAVHRRIDVVRPVAVDRTQIAM